MNPCPPIAEHGIIGGLRTAALVATGGDIDRWCSPRFDSPSLFASRTAAARPRARDRPDERRRRTVGDL
ncbi:hypothetical protein [Kitasatospora sp. NPDC005856]|uniref:hypothetical protein n=1 Tax=Kitasatospora sp. NPDC005856 TaxID=3154566 RepID=UPI0033EFB532